MVPFCLNIRQKLRQQQLQQRLQHAHFLKRRMAAVSSMSIRSACGTGPSTPGPIGSGMGPSSPLESPGAGDMMSLGGHSHHNQPGAGMKPATQTPPANVLQVK
jgi:E1A/CREB-binding protein